VNDKGIKMYMISEMCFLMAALSYGVLAAHYLTKDYYIKQQTKETK